MKIPVAGFDPSFTNWGIAEGMLDLETGILSEVNLTLIETEKGSNKQVRTNSDDLARTELLAVAAIATARRCKAIFVEMPVGSQSANGMKAYGVVVGVMGAIRALGIPVIEVTATEVKKQFTGNKNATKQEMIDQAVLTYPTANFPNQRGRVTAKAEHVADALGAIHAGVNTPIFQQIMRIYAEV